MSLGSLLNQSVSIKNGTGQFDLHGKPTLGSTASTPGRFEKTYKTIVTENQEREPIHGIVFVGPTVSVNIGAEVTYGSDKYRVMQLEEVVGRGGAIHHKELLVQLWSYGA